MKYLNLILFSIFTLLQIADAAVSYFDFKGDNHEANIFPVLQTLMDKLGVVPALILVKVVMVALVALTTWFFYDSIYLSVALGICCAGFVYVVWNNIKLLK